MIDVYFSRAKLYVFLAIAASMLAGCGGGSNSSNSSNGGGGVSNPVETSSGPSVFAQPSGPICSVKESEICIEPTSSAATLEQLIAILTDPQGPDLQLRRYGYTVKIHQQVVTTAGRSAILSEGENSYDSAEKQIVGGRNLLKLDGKTYAFESKLADGNLQFSATPNDKITIPSSPSGLIGFSRLKGSSSITGTPQTSVTATFDTDLWGSIFGLLTDKTDANVPASGVIRYDGYIAFLGGNGTPFAGTTFENAVAASCPIIFELDTITGKLVTSGASCTDIDNGATLNFSLRDFYIKDSRISAVLGDEATASANGRPNSATGDDENVPTVSVAFTSNKLGGAIYGKNALHLVIHGSGPLGSFNIGAVRQQ